MFFNVISRWLEQALKSEDLTKEPKIEYPKDLKFGDFTSNLCLIEAKIKGLPAMDLAEKFAEILNQNLIEEVSKVTAISPGFLNFTLSDKAIGNLVLGIINQEPGGLNMDFVRGKKIIVEYTDPNPFKEFHIGHLMTNTIGESISSILEIAGADVKRVCYQGDVGMHVAKAIYGALSQKKETGEVDWATAYATGSNFFDTDETAKTEIIKLNKKIYSKEDKEINVLYGEGKKWSLDKFEEIYKQLGTKFDHYFFESEVADLGVKTVKDNIGKIFEESDGAVIFPGEKYDLHSRVFLNSEGLPTYEAKELGLSIIKAKTFPADLYIVVTANEINEYFKVLKKTISLIEPELEEKILHLGHGMLRLPTGKMSSRTGMVITAESLILAISRLVKDKIKVENFDKNDLGIISEKVAVGALKYSILKQSVGGDIVFDFEKSISFEGDSGPYLMYSYARAKSVLRKKEVGVLDLKSELFNEEERKLASLLGHLPKTIEKTVTGYSSHFMIQYLLELTSCFNRFYANNKIIDSGENETNRLILTKAFSKILQIGLKSLGVPIRERM